jgi:hypothetical protein
MSDSIIMKEFEKPLSTWATAFLDLDTGVPSPILISYQNKRFDKTNVKLYLQTYLMPARTVALDVVGSTKYYSGYYQMNIISDDNGGAWKVEAIKDQLEKLFPIGMLGNGVRVSNILSSSPSYTDGNLYVLPTYSMYTLISKVSTS